MLPALALIFVAVGAAPVKDAAALKSRALYAEAQKTYDRGEIPRALELYLEAYDAKPLPGFLFNIAQCHRQLKSYARAGFYFKRYLELAPTTPNAAVVRDLIIEVDAKQAEQEELERSEAAAARAQEVELARIAAARIESEAAEQRQQKLFVDTPPPPPPPVEPSITSRWWFWTGVGVLVAGAAAGAGGAWVATTPSPRSTTLGTDSAR